MLADIMLVHLAAPIGRMCDESLAVCQPQQDSCSFRESSPARFRYCKRKHQETYPYCDRPDRKENYLVFQS